MVCFSHWVQNIYEYRYSGLFDVPQVYSDYVWVPLRWLGTCAIASVIEK